MYRCLKCRTRRKTWLGLLKHTKTTGHKACNCGGHGHYPYKRRPGSPYCTENIMGDVNASGEYISDEEYEQIKQKRLRDA